MKTIETMERLLNVSSSLSEILDKAFFDEVEDDLDGEDNAKIEEALSLIESIIVKINNIERDKRFTSKNEEIKNENERN